MDAGWRPRSASTWITPSIKHQLQNHRTEHTPPPPARHRLASQGELSRLAQQNAEWWAVLVFLGLGALFAGLYPLTQVYQVQEDRARGDRTLPVVLGARGSLRFALIAIATGFAVLMATAGASGRVMALPILLLAAWLWFRPVLTWYRAPAWYSARDHQISLYRVGNAGSSRDRRSSPRFG